MTRRSLDQLDTEAIVNTGDQTIAGIKTFSSSPIVPTPTTTTQVANKGYADTKTTLVEANSYDLGVGQAWQDVTASRVLGTTYTNSIGKPIVLTIFINQAGNASVSAIVGGATLVVGYVSTTTNSSFTIIIPTGATYSVSTGLYTLFKWMELR